MVQKCSKAEQDSLAKALKEINVELEASICKEYHYHSSQCGGDDQGASMISNFQTLFYP